MPAGLHPDHKHTWTQLAKWCLAHGGREAVILYTWLTFRKRIKTRLKCCQVRMTPHPLGICKVRPSQLSGEGPHGLSVVDAKGLGRWKAYWSPHGVFSGSQPSSSVWCLPWPRTCTPCFQQGADASVGGQVLRHSLWAGPARTLVGRFCC